MEEFMRLVIKYLPRIIALLICLPAREFAHSYVAYRLGDPTPKNYGRLTLNPFAHFDLFGFLCMFVTGFGWGKHDAINPFNFRDRKGGVALVAIAGPIANLCTMVIFAILARLIDMIVGMSVLFVLLREICLGVASVSLGLAIFHLLPIPPLDGSRILYYFLPNRTVYAIQQHEQTISIVVIIILVLGNAGILAFSFGDIIWLIANPVWKGLMLLLGFI